MSIKLIRGFLPVSHSIFLAFEAFLNILWHKISSFKSRKQNYLSFPPNPLKHDMFSWRGSPWYIPLSLNIHHAFTQFCFLSFALPQICSINLQSLSRPSALGNIFWLILIQFVIDFKILLKDIPNNGRSINTCKNSWLALILYPLRDSLSNNWLPLELVSWVSLIKV